MGIVIQINLYAVFQCAYMSVMEHFDFVREERLDLIVHKLRLRLCYNVVFLCYNFFPAWPISLISSVG